VTANRREVLAGLATCGAGGATQEPEPSYSGMTFRSHGKDIRSIHYRPTGVERKSAIVMMHGAGGRIRNEGPWHQLALQFAGDGYEVLTPSFTDAMADDGIRPARMMEAWRDVGEHAIDWFITNGIDRRRTAMFGISLGAYVAVDGALGNSRAAAAIGVAGGVDIYAPRPPRRRVPVLVIRAENDTHVLPRNTDAWINFLRDAEVPVREHTVRGADHIFRPNEWVEIFQVSAQFYGTNIGREIR
jgi:dienelactone hydrolase